MTGYHVKIMELFNYKLCANTRMKNVLEEKEEAFPRLVCYYV